MKHKDLDSQNRYQKAWDAMMAQKDRKEQPQSTYTPPEPEDDSTFFFWMCFVLGLVVGFGFGALFLAVLKGWIS